MKQTANKILMTATYAMLRRWIVSWAMRCALQLRLKTYPNLPLIQEFISCGWQVLHHNKTKVCM